MAVYRGVNSIAYAYTFPAFCAVGHVAQYTATGFDEQGSICARKLSFTHRCEVLGAYSGIFHCVSRCIECISIYILNVYHARRIKTLRRVSQ